MHRNLLNEVVGHGIRRLDTLPLLSFMECPVASSPTLVHTRNVYGQWLLCVPFQLGELPTNHPESSVDVPGV